MKTSSATDGRIGFRSILLYGVIALVTFLAASITMLPASVAARVLQHATNGQATLAATSGKAWNGRGDLLLKTGAKPIVVRDCSWNVLGDRLWAGELAVRFTFGGQDLSGQTTLARSMTTMAVRETRLNIAANLIAESIDRLRGWGAGGAVELAAERLELTGDAINGQADLFWRDATAIGFPTLGDFRLQLKGTGRDPATIQLTTLRGPLQVNGRGQATPGKVLRFNGTARAENGAPDKVNLLVGALGPRGADGAYAFELALPMPRLAGSQPAGAKAARINDGGDRHG